MGWQMGGVAIITHHISYISVVYRLLIIVNRGCRVDGWWAVITTLHITCIPVDYDVMAASMIHILLDGLISELSNTVSSCRRLSRIARCPLL